MSTLIFHSRPKASADWKCPRSRYYLYDYEGGIQKDNLSLEQFIGTTLHDGVAAIATQYKDTGTVDIDHIAPALRDHVIQTLTEHWGDEHGTLTPEQQLTVREQSVLVEGLLRGFHAHQWPTLIRTYPRVVTIEQETIYPHDENGTFSKKGPFVFPSKPDLVLAGDDGCVYVEIKSTGTKKLEWINSWSTAVQVHATTKGIEFTLNQPVLGTIVQGLYKGSLMFGKFSSDVVYGYARPSNPPFTNLQTSYEYRPGMRKFPVWDIPGGVKTWVENMPPALISEQFPQTPLIFPDQELIEAFFRQRAHREMAVLRAKEELAEYTNPDEQQLIMDIVFPQFLDKCTPASWEECPFKRICWNPTVRENPLAHGYIQRNQDHVDAYVQLAQELLD